MNVIYCSSKAVKVCVNTYLYHDPSQSPVEHWASDGPVGRCGSDAERSARACCCAGCRCAACRCAACCCATWCSGAGSSNTWRCGGRRATDAVFSVQIVDLKQSERSRISTNRPVMTYDDGGATTGTRIRTYDAKS